MKCLDEGGGGLRDDEKCLIVTMENWKDRLKASYPGLRRAKNRKVFEDELKSKGFLSEDNKIHSSFQNGIFGEKKQLFKIISGYFKTISKTCLSIIFNDLLLINCSKY